MLNVANEVDLHDSGQVTNPATVGGPTQYRAHPLSAGMLVLLFPASLCIRHHTQTTSTLVLDSKTNHTGSCCLSSRWIENKRDGEARENGHWTWWSGTLPRSTGPHHHKTPALGRPLPRSNSPPQNATWLACAKLFVMASHLPMSHRSDCS